MLYVSKSGFGVEYDDWDRNYNYITEAKKLNFGKGGEVEVAFDRNTGDIAYAKWTRPADRDFADTRLPKEFVYTVNKSG